MVEEFSNKEINIKDFGKMD